MYLLMERKAVVNNELMWAIGVAVPAIDQITFIISSSIAHFSKSEYIMLELTFCKIAMFVIQRFIVL